MGYIRLNCFYITGISVTVSRETCLRIQNIGAKHSIFVTYGKTINVRDSIRLWKLHLPSNSFSSEIRLNEITEYWTIMSGVTHPFQKEGSDMVGVGCFLRIVISR